MYQQELPGGAFVIRREPGVGFHLEHSYYGSFEVADDGSRVSCSPQDLPPWLWQRFLVGQLLPLAALLQGHEPLHASAAGIDGRAVLVMGTSGSGKSSVLLHLVGAGATFVADDVASLESRDGAVVAHTGPPLVSVAADELDRVEERAGRRWNRLGVSDREVRVVLEASAQALPVGAIYVLVRTDGSHGIEVSRLASGRPDVLLGGTFNAYHREPRRLLRQLEVAGRLAESVPLHEVRVPPGADARQVADAVWASARA